MIRSSFLKETVLVEKGVYTTEELCGGSNDRFFMGFPFRSFSFVITLEIMGVLPCSLCHEPYNPSEMRTPSLCHKVYGTLTSNPWEEGKNSDFDSKDFLCEGECSSDRGLSYVEYSLQPFNFSTPSFLRGDCLREYLPWNRLYYLSGREFGEDFFSEGWELLFSELREDDGKKGFDFCFGFSIFGIGFRGFWVEEAEEVPESVRVDHSDIVSFFSEEGEEVKMVNTSGLHTYEEGIFEGEDGSLKGEEALEGHREGRGEDKGGVGGDSDREGILRSIDTTKIVNHGDTSIDGLEGVSLPLNLLVEVCPEGTINLYETGREENMLLCEPKSLGRMVFHPLLVSFLEKFARKFK